MATTLNAFQYFQATQAVKFVARDRDGTVTTLENCQVQLSAHGGLVFQPQQSSAAPTLFQKNEIISISRHECSNKKGIQVGSRKQGIERVEVTFASPSSALALLHSMDHLWPDIRMDYCDCAAALLATCTRAKSDQVDRSVWPWALLTLVEYDPYRGKHEIECVPTDVVAVEDGFVFHLDGLESAPTAPPPHFNPSYATSYVANWKPKKLQSLHVRLREILEPPVAILHPFIGTKLRLGTTKYSHVQIEIPNKTDLYSFMNTMLFPWGQQISLKPSHSASIIAGNWARCTDDLKTAKSSSFTDSFGETTAHTARSISDHTLRTMITPVLIDAIVPLPAKRALKATDFFTISITTVVLNESSGSKAKLQLTNVGADRAVFRIRYNDALRHQLPQGHQGRHNFTAVRAFVESGRTFDLSIGRDPKEPKARGYYCIDFARAPAHFTDAQEAISKAYLAGTFEIVVHDY